MPNIRWGDGSLYRVQSRRPLLVWLRVFRREGVHSYVLAAANSGGPEFRALV